ncbi:unnamed protein product [Lampetra planeri]
MARLLGQFKYKKMETRRTNRTRSPDDASSDSPVGAAGGAEDVGVLPAAPPPAVQPIAASDGTQAAHARLAQLLHPAAAILEQLTLGAAGGEERPTAGVPAIENPEENVLPADGSRGGGSQAHAGTSGGQSQHTASSLSDAASAGPSSNTASSRPRRRTVHVVDQAIAAFGTESEFDEDDDTAALQQRLPVFREFSSTGGDWAAFQRRFLSHQEMVGWSDAQALRALPATLDDDSLAALISIPKRQRATLQAALQRLSDVYGPPSATRHQFYERRCKPRESPLAFRTALLAMARAAYPRMDDEAIDALVLQKLLEMARGLRLVIQAVDDEDMCSLRAARSIHAHLMLDQDETITASATTSVPASRDNARSPDRVFSTFSATPQRSPDRTSCRNDWERGRPFPRGDATCFNCGRRGHFSSDCRAPRRRSAGSRDRDYRASRAAQHNQASRGTPHARPSYTPQHTIDSARNTAYDTRHLADSSRPLRPGQCKWSTQPKRHEHLSSRRYAYRSRNQRRYRRKCRPTRRGGGQERNTSARREFNATLVD